MTSTRTKAPAPSPRRAADAGPAESGNGETATARLAQFFKRCVEVSWDGGDVGGGDIQDWAVELGLLTETHYDPEIHGESEWDQEPGDPWYVFSQEMKALFKARVDGRQSGAESPEIGSIPKVTAGKPPRAQRKTKPARRHPGERT